MCVCVCDHSTGRDFYPVATKFGTLVGLAKIHVKFEDGLYVGSIRPSTKTKNFNNFLSTGRVFNLNLSLDRTLKDVKLCIWR